MRRTEKKYRETVICSRSHNTRICADLLPLSLAYFFPYCLKRKKEEGGKEDGREKEVGGAKRRKDKRREVLDSKYVLNKYI